MGQKCNEKSVLCPHSIHPFIHPSIMKREREEFRTLVFLPFFFFLFFFSFFPFNMQCEEKALEIQSRKIPFVFSPPRRRFRKVLEGSSIYSFVASKMPHPRERERVVGCHRFPKPNNNYSLSHQSKIFLLWKKP